MQRYEGLSSTVFRRPFITARKLQGALDALEAVQGYVHGTAVAVELLTELRASFQKQLDADCDVLADFLKPGFESSGGYARVRRRWV